MAMAGAFKMASLLPGRPLRVILPGGLRGHVGNALGRNLTRDGAEVEVITSAQQTLTGLTWGEASHDFNHTLTKPRACDVVINVSGPQIFANLWNYQQRESVIDRRIESNEILSSLITKAARPPQLFVHVSSPGVFSRETDLASAPLRTEKDTPGAPADWWADTCQRWEAAAALPAGHPTRRVCLRPGWVLGADRGILGAARRWYGRGLAAYAAPGTQPFPWIHIDDLVALVRFIIDTPAAAGTLHAVAPEMVTQADAARRLATRLKKGVPAQLPKRMLDLSLHEERSLLLTSGVRLGSVRLHELGFRFKYATLDAALDDLLSKPLPKEHVPSNPNYAFLDPSVVPQHPPLVQEHH